jgi:hypothetical protein
MATLNMRRSFLLSGGLTAELVGGVTSMHGTAAQDGFFNSTEPQVGQTYILNHGNIDMRIFFSRLVVPSLEVVSERGGFA